jgi:hypothetical protein
MIPAIYDRQVSERSAFEETEEFGVSELPSIV